MHFINIYSIWPPLIIADPEILLGHFILVLTFLSKKHYLTATQAIARVEPEDKHRVITPSLTFATKLSGLNPSSLSSFSSIALIFCFFPSSYAFSLLYLSLHLSFSVLLSTYPTFSLVHVAPPTSYFHFLPFKAGLHHSPSHGPLIHRPHPSPSCKKKIEEGWGRGQWDIEWRDEEKEMHKIHKDKKLGVGIKRKDGEGGVTNGDRRI